MTRTAARKDGNQDEVVEALRAAGWTVAITARLGDGYPDLHVSHNGFAALVECKMPGEKLTPKEKAFAATWQGPMFIVESAADAVLKLGIVKQGVVIL